MILSVFSPTFLSAFRVSIATSTLVPRRNMGDAVKQLRKHFEETTCNERKGHPYRFASYIGTYSAYRPLPVPLVLELGARTWRDTPRFQGGSLAGGEGTRHIFRKRGRPAIPYRLVAPPSTFVRCRTRTLLPALGPNVIIILGVGFLSAIRVCTSVTLLLSFESYLAAGGHATFALGGARTHCHGSVS
ncbi:unnamed protein product [Discosporangium mesarthrocarpum]